MPSQQQQQFEGALDSIYNVIFANASSPPTTAPTSRDEVPGNAFSSALGEIVSKPYVYASDKVIEALDTTLEGTRPLKSGVIGAIKGQEVLKFQARQVDSAKRANTDINAGRLRVRVQELPDFLRHPGKYIDKVYDSYKQEMAKTQVAALTGRGMDFATAYGYAKKKAGMKHKDAISFALSSGYFDKSSQLFEANFKMEIENALLKGLKKGKIGNVSIDSLNDIGKLKDAIYQAYNSGKITRFAKGALEKSPEFKTEFDAALKKALQTNNITDSTLIQIAQELDTGIDPGTRMRTFDVKPGNYRVNYYHNRRQKVRFLEDKLEEAIANNDTAAKNQIAAQIEKLDTQGRMVEVWQGLKGNTEDYGFSFLTAEKEIRNMLADLQSKKILDKNTKKALKDLLKEIEKNKKKHTSRPVFTQDSWTESKHSWRDPVLGDYQRSENSKYSKRALEKQYQAKITYNQGLLKNPNLSESARIKLEKEISALKNTVGQIKNLPLHAQRRLWSNRLLALQYMNQLRKGEVINVAGIVGGTFFFAHPFSPGAMTPMNAQIAKGSLDKNGIRTFIDPEKNKFTYGTFAGDMIVVPRDNVGIYSALTDMYYLTPGSLTKSFLWNGELFKYKAVKKFRKIKMLTQRQVMQSPDLINLLDQLISDDLSTLTDYEKQKKIAENWTQLYNAIITDPKLRKKYAKFLKKLNPVLKRMERLRKLANRFGTPQRVVTKFIGRFIGNINNPGSLRYKASQTLLAQLIKIAPKNAQWEALLKKFLAGKAGAGAVFQALSKMILTGIGFTNPAGWMVTIVTWILPGIFSKLFKGFFKIFTTAVVFIPLIIMLLLGICVISAGSLFAPASHITPNEATGYPGYNEVGGVDPSGLPLDQKRMSGIPDGECPLSTGHILHVSNGSWEKGGTDFHKTHGSVDWWSSRAASATLVHSPVNGYVSSVRYVENCGGEVRITDPETNDVYLFMHVRDKVQVGQNISSGQVIASIIPLGEEIKDKLPNGEDNSCWTGPHIHTDIYNTTEGTRKYYDSENWIRKVCN